LFSPKTEKTEISATEFLNQWLSITIERQSPKTFMDKIKVNGSDDHDAMMKMLG